MGQECNSGSISRSDIVCLAYRIGSYESNAMKSPNPYSGIYETGISNTLDHINCGYPGCNQGGGGDY